MVIVDIAPPLAAVAMDTMADGPAVVAMEEAVLIIVMDRRTARNLNSEGSRIDVLNSM